MSDILSYPAFIDRPLSSAALAYYHGRPMCAKEAALEIAGIDPQEKYAAYITDLAVKGEFSKQGEREI